MRTEDAGNEVSGEFPHQWVRIFCDACADGVWNIRGEGCNADSLPITADLVERIRAWQADYDDRIDLRDEVTDQELDAFSVVGLQIAREVKRQLPAWTVIYLDETKARSTDPRIRYEYEIV